jgi:hypothetical protein
MILGAAGAQGPSFDLALDKVDLDRFHFHQNTNLPDLLPATGSSICNVAETMSGPET